MEQKEMRNDEIDWDDLRGAFSILVLSTSLIPHNFSRPADTTVFATTGARELSLMGHSQEAVKNSTFSC